MRSHLTETHDYSIIYDPSKKLVVLEQQISKIQLASIQFNYDAADHKAILSKLEFASGLTEDEITELANILIKSIREFTGKECRLLTIIPHRYQQVFIANGFLSEPDPRIMVAPQPKQDIEPPPVGESMQLVDDKEVLLAQAAAISALLKRNAYWAEDSTREDVIERIHSASMAIALVTKEGEVIGFVRSISNGHIDYTSDMVIDQAYQNKKLGYKLFAHLYHKQVKTHELSLLIRAGEGVGLETTPKLYKKFGYTNSDTASLPEGIVLLSTPRIKKVPAAQTLVKKSSPAGGAGLFAADRSEVLEAPRMDCLLGLASYHLNKDSKNPNQLIITQGEHKVATALFAHDPIDKKIILSKVNLEPGFEYLNKQIYCFLLEAIRGITGKFTRLFGLLDIAAKDSYLKNGLIDKLDSRMMVLFSPEKKIELPKAPTPITIIENMEELKRHSAELSKLFNKNAYWMSYCSPEEINARIDAATHAMGLTAEIAGKTKFVGFIRMITNGDIGYVSDLVIDQAYQNSGLGTLLAGNFYNKYMCNKLSAIIVIRAGAGTGREATPKLYAKASFVDLDKAVFPPPLAFFSSPPEFYPSQLNEVPTPPSPDEANKAAGGAGGSAAAASSSYNAATRP